MAKLSHDSLLQIAQSLYITIEIEQDLIAKFRGALELVNNPIIRGLIPKHLKIDIPADEVQQKLDKAHDDLSIAVKTRNEVIEAIPGIQAYYEAYETFRALDKKFNAAKEWSDEEYDIAVECRNFSIKNAQYSKNATADSWFDWPAYVATRDKKLKESADAGK